MPLLWSEGEAMKCSKVKPRLIKNDQGMPGWNVYVGRDMDFSKITVYPEAGTIYFEQTKAKVRP